MTVKDLISRLYRPVDFIEICYSDGIICKYDGFEPEVDDALNIVDVKSFEITARSKQISMCQIEIEYVLTINV